LFVLKNYRHGKTSYTKKLFTLKFFWHLKILALRKLLGFKK
jgi:hypothetical protein